MNVRGKNNKNVKNAFYPQNNKNVCKRDKNVTLFLVAFDVGPID